MTDHKPLELKPGALVSEDLRQVVQLTLDLAYYRVAPEDSVAQAIWLELALAVGALPEGEQYHDTRRRFERWARGWRKRR